jgi:hypothetical protein
MNRGSLELSEHHRRAVGVGLSCVDGMLCGIEAWLGGRAAHGVLYWERNDLPAQRHGPMRQRVAEVRELLAEARDRLGLEGIEVLASADTWSRLCVHRDTVCEMDAKHLRGYGELPPAVGRYMDGLSCRLLRAIDLLIQEIRGGA